MSDPRGRAGVVPFDFACHRCGHCCTAGDGYVWVEEEELPALAASKGRTLDSFRAEFVTTAADPRSGELRLSLTTDGGRCSLLDGANHCTVYEARPDHCKTFPYWESVLEDEAGFERARAVCPGIAVVVDPKQQRVAFEALEALYAEMDAEVAALSPLCELSGRCCRFEEFGHELYATALEADYAASKEAPGAPEKEGRCPFHVEGKCTNREGRALGCRSFYCDKRTTEALEELHERYLKRLRAIDYPASYGRFPALLAARSGIEEPS